jgi:hypothetical protein
MLTKEYLVNLVDDIQAFCNSADQTNGERESELAEEFSKACKEANKRLHKCGELLGRGHRAEAIALAEDDPHLLEVVSILVFPELDEWQDAAGTYGWERFPSLKQDVAISLNDAYSIIVQLDGFLQEHRRLAMAQAPVAERLACLRKIASIDSTTAYWKDDIHALELVRFEELNQLGNLAEKTRKIPHYEEFILAYEEEASHTVPPSQAAAFYASLMLTYYQGHALAVLGAEVAQAGREMNFQGLSQLRTRWLEITGRICKYHPQWQATQDLMNLVEGPFRWLAGEESRILQTRFQADVSALLDMIRGDATQEEIDAKYAEVRTHGFPLPMRIDKALAERNRDKKVSNVLSVVVVLSLVVAALFFIGIFFLIYRG